MTKKIKYGIIFLLYILRFYSLSFYKMYTTKIAAVTLTALTALSPLLASAQTENIGKLTLKDDTQQKDIVYTVANKTATATTTGLKNDGVLIKAKVGPTLSFKISEDEINLGNLSLDRLTEGSVKLELGTNAAAGAKITANSLNGGLKRDNQDGKVDHTIKDGQNGEVYKWAFEKGSDDSTIGGFTRTAGTEASITDNATQHEVMTTNKPEKFENLDDLTLKVKAQASSETPAGDYTDTIVLTVTGNF